MNLSELFSSQKPPKYTVKDLIQKTPMRYRERSEDVVNISYLGYKIIIKKQGLLGRLNLFIKKLFRKYKQDEILVAWVRLYFKVESVTYKNKFHTTMIEVPFRRDYTRYKLDDLPVRYFCSCESYKFFMAYTLNRSFNAIITRNITKYLGIALTKRPVIRNPREIQFYCKHTYAIILQVKNLTLDKFLKKEFKDSNKFD